MTTFGRQVLTNTGNGLQVTSDGQPEWLTGGSTIDWPLIIPVTTAKLLDIEGITVPAGSGYLRYGQIMCRIRALQTFVITPDATGGTYTVSVSISGNRQTTATIAYNALAEDVEDAIEVLSNVGVGNVTVPFIDTTGPYTVNFSGNLGTVTLTTDPTLLTGNTKTAPVTVAVGDSYTITNTSTDGTATITVTALGSTQTTAALDETITAAAMQTALRLLTNCTGVTVNNNGADFGSGTGIYTVTFPAAIGTTTVTIDGSGLTAANTWALAKTSSGNAGKWGPYDPNATDGRQTLTKGDCGILNQTILQNGAITGLGTSEASDHPGLITGGVLWKQRILMTTGSASLAAGPTVSAFETAFPRVRYALMF